MTAPTYPGRYLGLRRTDPERLRHTIRLPLTGATPGHPLVADHLARVPAWNGATNFHFGTCGPVSVVNSAIQTWKYLLGEDIAASDQAIYDLYTRSGNPDFDPATGADDFGVDMTVMLSALVKGGIMVQRASGQTEIVKPLCFAATPTAIDDVRAVTSIFGGALLAVTLQQAQQAQTGAGLWDYSLSPQWGGHAVLGGSYSSDMAAHHADEKVVTWMRPVGTTDDFMAHQLDEAYVVVWEPLWDHPAFQDGVDRAQLAADFAAETGRPFPFPAPLPLPDPMTTHPDRTFGHDQRVIDWATVTQPSPAVTTSEEQYAAQQYRLWRQARGYAP